METIAMVVGGVVFLWALHRLGVLRLGHSATPSHSPDSQQPHLPEPVMEMRGVLTSPNMEYLQAVRAESCYQAVRQLHDGITITAYILTVLSVGVSLLISSRTESGAFTGFLAVVVGFIVAVAIAIERAVFHALIDTADVVVDIGRRSRQRTGDGNP